MPILRDIVARLGLKLDDKGFKKADKSIKGVSTSLASLGSVIATSGVTLGLFKLVTMASDANETLNVLNASFEDNIKQVKLWAANFATEAGRSEFELREMAGTLGAVLNPMMERNADAAAEMSTRFVELAVDLGSFFNVADSDALAALRSGLTGEPERLKRFGIVMNDATLEVYALEQGISKNIRTMSIAEKTQLRYNFILEQTALAHGDAAKTSEGWANASKGLLTALKDMGTRIGMFVLPVAERMIRSMRDGIRTFMEFTKGTNLLKSALIILGAIAGKIAIGMLIAFAPVLLPIIKIGAASAIAALILDDFLSFMEGGDSIIGRFIDSLFGPGSATTAVTNLKTAWEGMVLFWDKEVKPAIDTLRQVFGFFVDDVGEWFKILFHNIGYWIDVYTKRFTDFINTIKSGIETAADFLNIDFKFDQPKPPPVAKPGEAEPQLESMDYEALQKRRENWIQHVKMRAEGSKAPKTKDVRVRAEGSKTENVKNNINQSVTVNVPAGTSPRDSSAIAKATSKQVNQENRKTLAALTQRAG